MSLLRSTRALRPFTHQPPFGVATTGTQQRLAHSDYGSGQGNPAGENPQQQGKNPSEDKEHPGPPPPSTGKDNSGGQPQKEQPQQEGGSSSSGQQSKGTQGAQPKLLSASPPTEADAPEGVQQHNREMSQRAERSFEKVKDEDMEKDKVPKGYWAGHGGADKDP